MIEDPIPKVREALASPSLDAVQKAAIEWQYCDHLALGGFRSVLWEAITLADDQNLNRLALAFPHEVQAVRLWRNGSLARDLRELSLGFDL